MKQQLIKTLLNKDQEIISLIAICGAVVTSNVLGLWSMVKIL